MEIFKNGRKGTALGSGDTYRLLLYFQLMHWISWTWNNLLRKIIHHCCVRKRGSMSSDDKCYWHLPSYLVFCTVTEVANLRTIREWVAKGYIHFIFESECQYKKIIKALVDQSSCMCKGCCVRYILILVFGGLVSRHAGCLIEDYWSDKTSACLIFWYSCNRVTKLITKLRVIEWWRQLSLCDCWPQIWYFLPTVGYLYVWPEEMYWYLTRLHERG